MDGISSSVPPIAEKPNPVSNVTREVCKKQACSCIFFVQTVIRLSEGIEKLEDSLHHLQSRHPEIRSLPARMGEVPLRDLPRGGWPRIRYSRLNRGLQEQPRPFTARHPGSAQAYSAGGAHVRVQVPGEIRSTLPLVWELRNC